jgi:hypothetical protein
MGFGCLTLRDDARMLKLEDERKMKEPPIAPGGSVCPY